MSRPVDWSPVGLAHDPIPGSAELIRHYTHGFSETAQNINIAAIKLSQVVADASGSEFIEEIKADAETVSQRLKQAQGRYARVAQSVRTYATPLQNAQDVADAALARARKARLEERSALSRITLYKHEMHEPGVTPEDVARYQHLIMQLNDDIRDWRGEINAATLEIQQAIEAVRVAANTAADLIQDVVKSDDLNDTAWDDFSQWMKENDAIIDQIVLNLQIVGAVMLVILMFVPGANLLVAAILIGMAVVAIVNALAQATTGNKPWGEAILDIVLAVIPLAGLKVAKGLLPAIVSEAKNSAMIAKMTSEAGQGISGWTRAVTTQFLESGLPNVSKYSQWLKVNILEEMGLAQLREIKTLANLAAHVDGSLPAAVLGAFEKALPLARFKTADFVISMVDLLDGKRLAEHINGFFGGEE
jgi:hypothetical protein